MLGAWLGLFAEDAQEFEAGRPRKNRIDPWGAAFRSAGPGTLLGPHLLSHRPDRSGCQNPRWGTLEDTDDPKGRIRALQQGTLGPDREIAFVDHGRQMDGFRGQGRDTPPLFPFVGSCRRLCGVLFHSQLHDPFDQVIGDRLIQGKLEIALRSSVACNSYFKRLVARNRWI